MAANGKINSALCPVTSSLGFLVYVVATSCLFHATTTAFDEQQWAVYELSETGTQTEYLQVD